jgi:hypothetical protein
MKEEPKWEDYIKFARRLKMEGGYIYEIFNPALMSSNTVFVPDINCRHEVDLGEAYNKGIKDGIRLIPDPHNVKLAYDRGFNDGLLKKKNLDYYCRNCEKVIDNLSNYAKQCNKE